METKLTFGEEIAVSFAICLRILELSKTVNDCRSLGHYSDVDVLVTAVDCLKSAFRKVTGVDFDCVHHD